MIWTNVDKNVLGLQTVHFLYCLLFTQSERYDTRSVFKWNTACLNSEFIFSETGFIPFTIVLPWRELQTALSKIWTRTADSISKYDNSYANNHPISLLYRNNFLLMMQKNNKLNITWISDMNEKPKGIWMAICFQFWIDVLMLTSTFEMLTFFDWFLFTYLSFGWQRTKFCS